MNLKIKLKIKFFNIFNFIKNAIKSIKKFNKCTNNTLQNQNEICNMVYCTICDLLHINSIRIEHCIFCNKCHIKNKILCEHCQNCYDYRIDSDLIRHRKNCKYSN